MRFKFVFIFAFLILPVVLHSSYLPDSFLEFLSSRVAGTAVGNISSVDQGFYIANLSDSSSGKVVVGDEVLVLKAKKGLPLSFLPISAIARVEGIAGELIKLTPLVVFDEVKPGDVVGFPSRVGILVVAYQGVPRKDVSRVMRELLSVKGLSVKEVFTGSLGDYRKRRGYFILLKLTPEMEKEGLFVDISLESLYTGDIFFLTKVKSSVQVQVPAPPAQPVPSPQPAGQPYQYTYGYRPTPPPPSSTFAPRKGAGYYIGKYGIEEVFSDNGLGGYRCVTSGDVDGDGDDEVILLGKGDFIVLNYTGGRFSLLTQESLPIGGVVPINVDVADLNGNGRSEIFVTVIDVEWDQELPKPKVLSYIYEWNGRSFDLLYGDIALYLRVIKDPDTGAPILIAQEMGDYQLYSGHIMQIVWDGKSYTLQDPPPYIRGVKSIYGFSLLPGRKDEVVYVDDVGRVSIRDGRTWKKIKYYDTTIGMFDDISVPIPLETPMATSKTDFVFWEPKYRERKVVCVPELNGQIFTIDKGKAKSRLVRVFTQTTGEDSVIAFSFTGSSLEETWRSVPVRRYISDFAFGDPTGMRRFFLFVLEVGEDGSAHLGVIE